MSCGKKTAAGSYTDTRTFELCLQRPAHSDVDRQQSHRRKSSHVAVSEIMSSHASWGYKLSREALLSIQSDSDDSDELRHEGLRRQQVCTGTS